MPTCVRLALLVCWTTSAHAFLAARQLAPLHRERGSFPPRAASRRCRSGADGDAASPAPAPRARRRRRGAWAQPRRDPAATLPDAAILDAVASEVASDCAWEQVADEMLELFPPSVGRVGAAAYARAISTADESSTLRWIRAETRRRFSVEEASMQVLPEQGKWLAQLAVALNASRALELGTFTGYSSTALAGALPPHGHLLCCDVSDAFTAVAREAWGRAGGSDKISLHLGQALPYVQQLLAEGNEGQFDLVFIDADKENYLAYYEAALRLVRVGGAVYTHTHRRPLHTVTYISYEAALRLVRVGGAVSCVPVAASL